MRSTSRRRQRGMSLITGLIMLVLATLVVLASYHLEKSEFQIVANAQHRAEATAAGQRAIDEVIGSKRLVDTPDNIFLVPCTVPNTKCYDVNGDGTNDVQVTLAPTPSCIKAETVKNANLSLSNPDDQVCVVGVQQRLGVIGAEQGDSLCSNAMYEVNAVVDDVNPGTTGARVVLTEGVSVRVQTVDVDTSCP